MRAMFRSTAVAVLCLAMCACGGGGDGGGGGGGGTIVNGTSTLNVTFGGTISGLGSLALRLRTTVTLDGNPNSLSITSQSNGAFSLTMTGSIGATYAVTIEQSPAGQACTVANGSGTITGASVMNIVITCTGTPSLGTPSQVSAGLQHTCVRFSDGNNAAIRCWGGNTMGQLGIGSMGSVGNAPGQMGANLPAANFGRISVAVAAGGAHTCALLVAGDVKCWGAGGVLGLGDNTARGLLPADMGDNLPEVDFDSGLVTQVTAGNGHTCVRIPLAGVKCWGMNAFGQLGLGDIAQRGDGPNEMGANLPLVDLGTSYTAADFALGFAHTCALSNNGVLKCWGANGSGQLGLGDTENRGDEPGEMGNALPAVNLGAGRTVTAAAAGDSFTCALLDDASVKCWGANSSGQLGLENTTPRATATAAVNLGAGLGALELAAGQAHVCARLNNGTVKCWGANDSGQLGLGDTAARGDDPGEMGDNLPQVDLGGNTATQLASFGAHTCALLDNATVKCWGANSSGQLGLGDTDNRGDAPNEMGGNLPAVNLGN